MMMDVEEVADEGEQGVQSGAVDPKGEVAVPSSLSTYRTEGNSFRVEHAFLFLRGLKRKQ